MKTLSTLLFFSIFPVLGFTQYTTSDLTPQQIRNLTAFTKLYGYVRFFQPTPKALTTNWDQFVVDGAQQMLLIENDLQLMTVLKIQFAPLAPSLQISSEKLERSTSAITPSKKYIWHHKGNGTKGSKNSIYKSEIVSGTPQEIKEKYEVDINTTFTSKIVDSIYISLSLGVEESGKLVKSEKKSFDESLLEVRLAGIMLVWAEFQHFYPYWDVVETDWNTVLPLAFHKASKAKNTKEYKRTLERLIEPSQDGHGNVNRIKDSGKWRGVPLWLTNIENKIVVQKCLDCEQYGIHPGDELIEFNQQAAMQLFLKKKSLKSGSDQLKISTALESLRYSASESDSVELKLKNKEGISYTTRLPLLEKVWKQEPYQYDKIQEIENGIYYVSLDRIKDKDFKSALPKLEKAKSIIFELKVYPNGGIEFLHHLSKKTIRSARWNIPEINYPDQLEVHKYDTNGRWEITPKKPYLGDKNIVFIISGRAISYAESILGIVEHYQLGAIVGKEPSAGTNGNVNFVNVLGNYSIMYTGMKVIKHDYSQHHLIGIQPTHPVEITLDGITQEKDELIEKALEIGKQRKK